MDRRRFVLLLLPAAALAQGSSSSAFRGKLVGTATAPVLVRADGRLRLTGDADTEQVLHDARLEGMEFEVIGRRNGDAVLIDPIHTASFFVVKDGRRFRVTYWCDVCAIRTYTPGLCMCCREETVLDLREPDKVGS